MSNDARTVAGWLRRRADDNPAADMVSTGNGWLTVGEVRSRSTSLAAGLYRAGLRPGDRIASIMTNRPESVLLFFACAELGVVQVPVNVFLKGEFLRYQLADAEPSMIVADAAGVTALAALDAPEVAGARLVALDPESDAPLRITDLYDEPRTGLWPDPEPTTLTLVMYTSGTTGAPKGCMIDSGYLVHMPLAHAMNDWFRPDDTSYCPLPLYHGFAISALMDSLVVGSRVCFDPEFRASLTFDRIRELGATQMFGVGAMPAALMATPERPDDTEHTLDRAIYIPTAPALQQKFAERFGCTVYCEGYGQTEVLPATMGRTTGARDKPSAGKALPWLDVRAVDDDDNVLPAGQPGEIVVRPLEPHAIFSGYWRKPEATLDAWRNLWHHTGDMGYFDDEGTLYFVDRKKDALRRRGENVSSVELEQAIGKHPDIAAVAVHAVPSELAEDDIKACLVLAAGADVEPGSLFEFFKANLPYFAIPRYVEVIDALPVNAVGRVLKHQLRAGWDTPGTIDLEALGHVVARSDRR
ncbi:AMP-binding protein [Nakamurella lactea]|uniref:AMP-binding protein n=1 Tax=Nakamurella lactea TaxID=459515 RepID=UPI0006869372|nr:AMP-binding protein [Nakamurella lactea]